MKNLLVTSGTTSTDLSKLPKGDWAIVTAAGVVQSEVPTTGMYKYVVGLGDGKNIEGLWLNAEDKHAELQSYNVGATKKITIGTVNIDLPNVGEATLHIHTQPKTAFSGQDFQEFVAAVPIYSTTQDGASIKTALLAKVKEVIVDINKYFGVDVLEITSGADKTTEATVLESACFRAKSSDFNFNISFGGAAHGVTTVTDTLSFGTQAEVIKLEKEMAVSTFGYNPNFEAGDHAYGDVLLAGEYGKTTGYDIIVITSIAPTTDQMPLNAGAAKVEQWIAVPHAQTCPVKY